ncbi:alkane hydroxylase MAH1 [Forsythia ovata]|uniref:Alkane hydroxylase MAH1 n=1 Tax=Forsythia ovata TaxID=205694 RepID=A0ABD1QCA2_9LAMI
METNMENEDEDKVGFGKGRDTTSTTLTWFFWLIASNPLVEIKILEEIETKFHVKETKQYRFFNAEESRKLVYLHGALCETLRLYPPVALEHKSPIRPDILPSGHCIPQNTRIILVLYSTGRMERIWGKDCLEFKPERWISEHGGIKHEPSFKFPAFNAGPRTCIGKEMSFVQMKMVVATIILNYHVQVVEAHSVSPSDSIIIQMKHGLKIMFFTRRAKFLIPFRSIHSKLHKAFFGLKAIKRIIQNDKSKDDTISAIENDAVNSFNNFFLLLTTEGELTLIECCGGQSKRTSLKFKSQ